MIEDMMSLPAPEQRTPELSCVMGHATAFYSLGVLVLAMHSDFIIYAYYIKNNS